MTINYGFTWNGWLPDARRFAAIAIAAMVLALSAMPGMARLGAAAGEGLVSVIVREQPGAGERPEQRVADLGGRVGRQLAIIDGFQATVPGSQLAAVRTTPGVHSVTQNGRVRLLGVVGDGLGFDDPSEMGNMWPTGKTTGAHSLWAAGITGKGVDVALIDSGVVPVPELGGRIVNGPDLSLEQNAENLRYLDTYGHGTHMAGIIAGRDPVLKVGDFAEYGRDPYFVGIAPDSRIVNLKVAPHSGATDVSQVIAAIDWVVQHKNSNGLNIRVLNLSFGTDGTQSYLLDPLAYAAEVAWRKGIVVVVAGGNAGFGSTSLNNPAYDPFVLAVGASDTQNTIKTEDDTVATFSSRGDSNRRPDLVAPGKSVVSLRSAGSLIDVRYSAGRVGTRFFKGSGTSQSAAVVSGAAALLLQQRPELTPDQVKKLLTSTTTPMPAADPLAAGAGMLDVRAASRAATPVFVQTFPISSGLGSLEAARGSVHVSDGTAELYGEYDILGGTWDGATWAPASLSGNTWSGGSWNGNTWTGNTWSGNTWSGNTWSGNTWSGNTWSGNTWSGNTWSGNTWSGNTWSGNTWSGNSWSGSEWGG